MSKKSIFREVINYDGTRWHLVYDPRNPNMAAPSLEGGNLSPLTVSKVKFPNGRDAWIVTMGVIFPANTDITGRVMNARRMLAFRTFDREPKQGEPLPYKDMAYYLAEPENGNNSAAQKFLDAITGKGQSEEQEQEDDKPDSAWTDMFVEAEEVTTVPASEVQVVS